MGIIVPLDEMLTDTLSDKTNKPLDNVVEINKRDMLAKEIDNLPEKERLLLALYYYEELTLKEISLIMKVSEARISQIHSKAIGKLKKIF